MPDNIRKSCLFNAVLVIILCNKISWLAEVWIMLMHHGTPRILLKCRDACEALDCTNFSLTFTGN